VNKQAALVVAAVAGLALAAGAAIGFIWHAPGDASTWADVRAWVTFAVVLVGVPTALIQLNLQRLQLRSQQKVISDEADRNKRRDELLDGQLRELEQRAQVLERQQAEAVEFSGEPGASLPNAEDPSKTVHMAVVRNMSGRPIRDVVCRIKPNSVQDYDWEAAVVAELASSPPFRNPRQGGRALLIRAGQTFGFRFPFPVVDHPDALMKVRFTDDAGLHWEIDSDLRLVKLAGRDW
jgi:hypothetical protein